MGYGCWTAICTVSASKTFGFGYPHCLWRVSLYLKGMAPLSCWSVMLQSSLTVGTERCVFWGCCVYLTPLLNTNWHRNYVITARQIMRWALTSSCSKFHFMDHFPHHTRPCKELTIQGCTVHLLTCSWGRLQGLPLWPQCYFSLTGLTGLTALMNATFKALH